MNRKTKTIFAVVIFFFFLILYPYSKQPAQFRSDDITWKIFHNSNTYKRFDFQNFGFKNVHQINEKIKALDSTQITIKGFIVIEKHGGAKHIILSETVTDACFMCNHDENNPAIQIIPKNKNSKIFRLKQDDYVKIKGTFAINKNNDDLMTFILKNPEIVEE